MLFNDDTYKPVLLQTNTLTTFAAPSKTCSDVPFYIPRFRFCEDQAPFKVAFEKKNSRYKRNFIGMAANVVQC